jgi:hypothetical protein
MATLTDAFEHFDAPPTNIRWSWSAFSRDGSRLVCALYQHEFRGKDFTLWSNEWDQGSVGFAEQLRNLRRAIDERIPITGFIVVAKDPKASELKIVEARRDRLLHLKIIQDIPEKIIGRIAKTELA